MFLAQLKLWNFRKFGKANYEVDLTAPHLIVDFNKGINLLVGENDSGKSAIIDAIKLVLRTHSLDWIRVEEDDFYLNSERFRIECVFRGLEDNEAKHFLEWLSVEKTMEATGEIQHGYLRVILDVKRALGRILPYDIKGGSDEEGRVINAEAKEYLKSTYLKPLRDAKAELIARKNSRLSQILYNHPVFKEKENHKLVQILVGANDKIRQYFDTEEEKNTNGYVILETLKNNLSRFLKKDSPQNTRFHIDDPKLKNILEILKLTLHDERSGLGTYNLLFVAAELLHLRKENYDGLKLGLIEEIEAHLHPQAQLRVMTALETESNEGNVQLILTTHSPNLASKVKVDNLILCYGDMAYSLGSNFTKLGKADYNFLERFLDVTKANLFFAQGVILVEGDAENILIPTIAKIIGKDLAAHGVSVVNVGGTAFLRYARIFQRKDGLNNLKLPVSVVTDLDVKPDDESSNKANAIQKKEQKYGSQSVKVFVSPHWTLEYCIALSGNLRQILFDAIKLAGEEMTNDGYTGKRIDDDWLSFSNGFNDIDLAKKIYQLITPGGKDISKSITAQYIAKIFESKISEQTFVTNLKNDAFIKYIINAINYATSNIDNG